MDQHQQVTDFGGYRQLPAPRERTSAKVVLLSASAGAMIACVAAVVVLTFMAPPPPRDGGVNYSDGSGFVTSGVPAVSNSNDCPRVTLPAKYFETHGESSVPPPLRLPMIGEDGDHNEESSGDKSENGNDKNPFGKWDVMKAVGKTAYDVVVAGKAVVDYEEDRVSIYPDAVTVWSDMEFWRPATWAGFKFDSVNILGMRVAEFAWSYSWNHSGKYEGIGHYISGATVSVTYLTAMWGHTVKVRAVNHEPFNMGSKSDPIAAFESELFIEVENQFGVEEFRCLVVLQGDGQSSILDCPLVGAK